MEGGGSLIQKTMIHTTRYSSTSTVPDKYCIARMTDSSNDAIEVSTRQMDESERT
jgi:hypothetical protein